MPFPSPGDLPDPGIKPGSTVLQADSFSPEPLGKPQQTGTSWSPYSLHCSQNSVFCAFLFLKCVQKKKNVQIYHNNIGLINLIDDYIGLATVCSFSSLWKNPNELCGQPNIIINKIYQKPPVCRHLSQSV